MGKKLIIFTDIGDTIIDEGTEVRNVPNGVVLSAECIPTAKETYLQLHEAGYPICMVADGLTRSFQNTMSQNGLEDIFQCRVISEELGVEKPNQSMFITALKKMGLKEEDKKRIIMIGNNLGRDVKGANQFGIRSVFLDWSPRYLHKPNDPEEVPTYTIHEPRELLALTSRLEEELGG